MLIQGLAIATEVQAAFYHVKPSDIMSNQVGQAEKNISDFFSTVRKEKRAVLFIDEIESLVPSRRRNRSTIMQRMISQVLSEVDGFSGDSDGHVLLIVGATNEPEMIDAAMMRPGRLDAHISVGLPNREARKKILAAHLKDRPVANDVDLDFLAEMTDGMSGAEIRNLVERVAARAFTSSSAQETESRLICAEDFLQERGKVTPNKTPSRTEVDVFKGVVQEPVRMASEQKEQNHSK